ncbi:MAG: hypothetical protein M3417_04655 [Actinomycetota bacterium]|nr:hypothetical protein [Actinomycetota bacterium]MDQ3630562.1 hypothetical protein [Actinomycetota bacterium]
MCVLPMLGMGRDTPDGAMTLEAGMLKWTGRVAGSKRYFDRVRGAMHGLAEALGATGFRAHSGTCGA